MERERKSKTFTGRVVEKTPTSSSGHLTEEKKAIQHKGRIPFDLPKLYMGSLMERRSKTFTGEKTSTSSSGQLTGGKKAKRYKGMPFDLPKPGEPGGIDAPLRKGLSGAGVRKYLRLHNQGISPKEARKQVIQHPIPPKEPPTGKTELKRNPEHITPPLRPLSKKSNIAATVNGQSTDYAAALKTGWE